MLSFSCSVDMSTITKMIHCVRAHAEDVMYSRSFQYYPVISEITCCFLLVLLRIGSISAVASTFVAKKMFASFLDLFLCLNDSVSWLLFCRLFHMEGFCQVGVFLTYVFGFLSVWIVMAFTAELYLCMFHPKQGVKVKNPIKSLNHYHYQHHPQNETVKKMRVIRLCTFPKLLFKFDLVGGQGERETDFDIAPKMHSSMPH